MTEQQLKTVLFTDVARKKIKKKKTAEDIIFA